MSDVISVYIYIQSLPVQLVFTTFWLGLLKSLGDKNLYPTYKYIFSCAVYTKTHHWQTNRLFCRLKFKRLGNQTFVKRVVKFSHNILAAAWTHRVHISRSTSFFSFFKKTTLRTKPFKTFFLNLAEQIQHVYGKSQNDDALKFSYRL